MKKNTLYISLVFFILSIPAYAQVSAPNNTPTVGNYVGFNNTSMDPLPIENRGDPRINISSNGSNKFAILELPSWTGLNGLSRTRVQRTTMGLQNETDTAWSMLHLWSGGTPISMYRDWFNVGTSYTGNEDFMYTGLLERPTSDFGSNLETDAVIAWGCQAAPSVADNFRIIFLTGTSSSSTAGNQQGLETFRITPWGNIGIGDYSAAGLDEQPTHRLDVDGTARLRLMPTDTIPDVIITGVQQDALGDYELNYIPFADLGGNDCRWTDMNSTTVNGELDIHTGWSPLDNCNRGKVNIGFFLNKWAKLEVHNVFLRDSGRTFLFRLDDSTVPAGAKLYQGTCKLHPTV